MTDAKLVWNRAATHETAGAREQGDVALSALLRAHGLAMNGGVLHAVKLLGPEQLADSQRGYEFFGLASVAGLLQCASQLFSTNEDLGHHEPLLDAQYARLIPDDSVLFDRFEQHRRSHPSDFAPL